MATPSKRPVLRLLAQDYAGIGNNLPAVERIISQMYSKAGIEVRWRTAHFKRGKNGHYELIGMNPGGNPDATLRFMPDTTGLTMTDDGLGASMMGSNLANVMMNRVDALRDGTGNTINPEKAAALAAVHELGHAVFSFPHVPKTIMRANFPPDQIADIGNEDPWNAQQITAIQRRVSQFENSRATPAPKLGAQPMQSQAPAAAISPH